MSISHHFLWIKNWFLFLGLEFKQTGFSQKATFWLHSLCLSHSSCSPLSIPRILLGNGIARKFLYEFLRRQLSPWNLAQRLHSFIVLSGGGALGQTRRPAGAAWRTGWWCRPCWACSCTRTLRRPPAATLATGRPFRCMCLGVGTPVSRAVWESPQPCGWRRGTSTHTTPILGMGRGSDEVLCGAELFTKLMVPGCSSVFGSWQPSGPAQRCTAWPSPARPSSLHRTIQDPGIFILRPQ